jgi:hypothetical protein
MTAWSGRGACDAATLQATGPYLRKLACRFRAGPMPLLALKDELPRDEGSAVALSRAT